MKECSKCHRSKDFDEFYRRTSGFYKTSQKVAYQPWCKDCMKEDKRQSYSTNPEYYAAKAKDYIARANQIIREKKDGPCSVCKLKFHYSVMDFHHRDPTQKILKVSSPKLKRSRARKELRSSTRTSRDWESISM